MTKQIQKHQKRLQNHHFKRNLHQILTGTVVRDLPAALREATSGTQLEYRCEGENATVHISLENENMHQKTCENNVQRCVFQFFYLFSIFIWYGYKVYTFKFLKSEEKSQQDMNSYMTLK